MGKHFGNLQKLSGAIYYSLSPQELNPLKGILFPGISNTLRRLIIRNIFPMGIPLAISYCVYYSFSEDHKKFSRKNPEDYKNDV